MTAIAERARGELSRRADAAIGRERSLAARVRLVLCTELDVLDGYPDRPPLGACGDEALWRRVVAGAATRSPDPDLAAALPTLLAAYERSVVAFWRTDTSPGRARTMLLVDGSAKLVERLVAAAGSPELRPIVTDALALARELRAG